MIRNILQRIKESKGGFTLVELMVTMVLVGILLGASAAGIFLLPEVVGMAASGALCPYAVFSGAVRHDTV